MQDAEINHRVESGIRRVDAFGIPYEEVHAVPEASGALLRQGHHRWIDVKGNDLGSSRLVKQDLHAHPAATAQLQDLRKTTRPDDFSGRVETWKLTYSAFFDFVDRYPQELLMIVRGGFGVDEDHDQSLWAFFYAFAEDMARDFQKWMDLGFLQGLNPFLMGQITVGMCLQTAHSYIEDRKFSRREAINTLMALNSAMFSIYLTDKGRKELGDLSVPQLPEHEE